MKRKSAFIAVALAVVLVLSVLLLACAPGGGGAKPGKPYDVQIYTLSVGSSGYAVGTAMAQFLTERGSWVKATVLESPNPTVNAKQIIENPKLRPHIIGLHNNFGAIISGVPPYDYNPPYQDVRSIFSYTAVQAGWVTNDPNIKEAKDLAGKTVAAPPASVGPRYQVEALIASGATGIKVADYDFAGRVRALKDGLASAAWIAGLIIDVKHMKVMGNPAATELLTTQPVINFISYKEGAYDAVNAKYGLPPAELMVPAGAWGPKQKTPWRGEVIIAQFIADKSMPDDVVYEIVKATAENASRFKDFTPAVRAISPETMPQTNVELKYMHPGAVKYYKEIGVDQFIGKKWLD